MTLSPSLLDELWDFDDAVGSEARLRAAAEAETDAATRAELATQVARALDVLDGTTDVRTLRWAVSLHSNAGWTHFDAGRLDDAVVEFEHARDAAARWGTPQQVRWADEALAEARAAL